MEKIYKNQTALELNLSVGSDITGYSEVVLNVTYPDATTSAWTCTVVTASTGTFTYTVTSYTILKTIGMYVVQPKVDYTDSQTSYGTSRNFRVFNHYE